MRHAEGLAAVQAAFAEGWLRIEPLPDSPPVIAGLHLGELESIALALGTADTLLLMDESDGRSAAGARGIIAYRNPKLIVAGN